VNPLWSPDCALPSLPHIQAVQDVAARDLRSLVTLPLGIPQVQVIINEIYEVQPRAESQMCPVVRSANRHAELGAVPVSPPFHPPSFQSPQRFHTARSQLVAHEMVPVASSSSSSSTSSWSPSSCDSLMARDHHKVVSDRSASDQSERSRSAREPSLVDMRHEVPSVSLVRPQVVVPSKAQQMTALTGPAVKSASTAQKISKVYNYGSCLLHLIFALQDYSACFLFAPLRLTLPVSMVFSVRACFWLPLLLHSLFTMLQTMLHIAWAAQYNAWLLIKLMPKGVAFSFLHIGQVCLSQPILLCFAAHCHHVKAASDHQPPPP